MFFAKEKTSIAGQQGDSFTRYDRAHDSTDTITEKVAIGSDDDLSLSSQEEAGDAAALANSPWQYKLVALVTALLFPFGSHFSVGAISAMKSSIKTNLSINNTQYGVLSSSVSIVNTIFPIAGGIFIDMFGTVWGTLAINSVIVIGSLLTAIAAKYNSYGFMVAGRIIFGIGSGLIVTMQETILSKWFRTQNLAIAIGLQLSFSRLATFLGTLVANPIAVKTGDWVWAFWLSFIICIFSTLLNIIYALVVRHLRRGSGQSGAVLSKQDIAKAKKRKAFHWKSLLKFPTLFWNVVLVEAILGSLWSSFQTISTEFVQLHFGKDNTVLAGYTASVSQSVPIVATPILGIIMDLFGLRITILLISAIFLIVSCALLGWTYVNATVGMVFYSISLAFGLVGLTTSVGMVLPSDYIGTGLGMYRSSNSIGTTILDIVIGIVQDKTANQSYYGVMILFISLAGVAFIAVVTLWASQYYYHDNLLEASRKKRLASMEQFNSKEVALNKRGLDSFNDVQTRPLNYVFLGIYLVCLLVAWVLFFVYAATGRISR